MACIVHHLHDDDDQLNADKQRVTPLAEMGNKIYIKLSNKQT
jgi:hypothetical protein